MSEAIVEGTGLTMSELESLGVTRRNVRRAGRRLLRQGEIDGSMTKEEMAGIIFDHLASEQPQVVKGLVAKIDWDGLLAFIEKLLPIILQIIAMF